MLAIPRNLMLLACALFVVACSRFGDARIVGTWRCEIEDRIDEITFNEDHSFQSLLTFKDVLTTPSPIEATGTWRTKGNQIQLDAIVTWNKQRKKEQKTLVGATHDALLIRSFDGKKTLTYQRVEWPECNDVFPINAQRSLREADLLGSWKTHYNTHDYEFRFLSGSKLTLLAFISGKEELLSEGTWRVEGSSLLTQELKEFNGRPKNEPEQEFRVISVGADCFVMRAASAKSITLRRLSAAR